MDIRVGDLVTYINSMGNARQVVIKDEEQKIKFINNVDTYKNILKIERPKYEVVEEKKELLTEEEKEFLRIFNKIEKNKIKEVQINTLGELCITNNFAFTNFIHTKKFQNLEKNKKYTLKELGLEEK